MSEPPKPVVTNRIKSLRFEHDQMTQENLARQVGVTRQTIIALEANKYVPSLALAFRIAKTFRSGIEDVFDFSD